MSRNVVTFHYILRDSEGRLLDSSTGGQPISYLEGAGQIIDGLDEAMVGLPVGTKTRIEVPAARGYGEREEAQVQKVLRDLLPVEGELQVGDRFQAGTDTYAPIVTVMGVEGNEVLLDANHPLAGVDLTFDVEVIELREATAEEIEHGHVHQPESGCCGGQGGCEGGDTCSCN